MLIQLIAIVLTVSVACGSFFIYSSIDRSQHIEYSESSSVDYKVQYKENDYFEEEWLDSGKSYISSLVNSVVADFAYNMNVDSDEVRFNYKFYIDATLLVINERSGATYYTVEESLVPVANVVSNSKYGVAVKQTVDIDYRKFNDIATSFIKTYNLSDAKSTLSVTLRVENSCSGGGLSDSAGTVFSSSLNIPLAEDTFSIYSTTSDVPGRAKSFEVDSLFNRQFFFDLFVGDAIAGGVLIIALIIFLRLTRNEDITYYARVKRIYRAYSSFIQRIEGEFDATGYQLVMVKTFNEMLGIRDTINSPILMLENRDETMTSFFIPTNTKLLYVFEIKVDNFDEIYSKYNYTHEEISGLVFSTANSDVCTPLKQSENAEPFTLVVDYSLDEQYPEICTPILPADKK